VPKKIGVNPLVNSQQLSDEKFFKVLNKVSVEVEAIIFRRNDRVIFLEQELEKEKKELVKKRKYLKKEYLINAQL
ncbi:hypothetical protein KI387_031610, partial [Taxus chinensis]